MPASTADTTTGMFLVTARFPAEIERTDPAEVRNLLDDFLLAIDYGFFNESQRQPAVRVPESTHWEESQGELRVRFSAERLSPAAFTILNGMFAGLAEHVEAEITSAVARHEGMAANLLTSPAPPLPSLGELPFKAEIPLRGNLYKSLRVWLDFQKPIPKDEQDRLIELFAVWDRLVTGPFPAQGRAIGDSWAANPTTSFLLPTRVEHFVEDYESGHGAFDVLLRALLRLNLRSPIEAIEIE
jgi:hypothetical protein